MPTIILHHFDLSPFAEKARLALGLKGLAWRSVEIPMVMPKPDLTALTGGYRKTPVMQIGADVYCDTRLIALELESRHPTPTLFPAGNRGLSLALGAWSDRGFFESGAGLSMGLNKRGLPAAVLNDRKAFFNFMDFDIGSGIILGALSDGSQRIFVGLKSGMALALDPAKHDHALWKNRVGRGSIQGGIQFGMAFDGQRLYVPISDMGNAMDASNKARDASAGLPRPGLYALDPYNGELLWQNRADDACHGRQYCDSGILSSIVAIPGAVFAGHMDGRLRAYDAATGAVLWQYDTTQPLTALGGATAHGGSIGGGGPVIHDGMVYTNSGYGLYFHMPGNALLAFSVDGR